MLKDIALKIRRRESPFYDRLFQIAKMIRRFEVPPIKPVYQLLAWERSLRLTCWNTFMRVFYHTPIFKLRCQRHLRLNIGDDVIMHGASTLVGAKVFDEPTLHVGNNTHLGYQLIVDVGCDVTIGNNVLIADRVIIRSYDGHPTDPAKRHLPAPPESSKPITIGDNAWIGAGCIIMKGVTIGEGAVVAAGSVVTTKVPPNSLAIGNPARIFPLMLR